MNILFVGNKISYERLIEKAEFCVCNIISCFFIVCFLSKLSRLELENKQLKHDVEILKHDLTVARR